MKPRNQYPRNRGFTLVELLVAVALIVTLLAVTIPALKVVTQGDKVGRASRLVNSYFVLAQSRAVESRRPVGVWIERISILGDQAITLYMAEVPPDYTGDFASARAVLGATPGPDGIWGTATGGANGDGDDDENGIINDASEKGMGTVPPGDDFTANHPDFNGSWKGALATKHLMGPDGVWGTSNGGSSQDGDDDNDGTPKDPDEYGFPGSDDLFLPDVVWFDQNSFSLLTLVSAGDSIQFNNQGPFYPITNVRRVRLDTIDTTLNEASAAAPNQSQTVVMNFLTNANPYKSDGRNLPRLDDIGAPVPYKIRRQPIRSSVRSIELPKGTVIDLGNSGIGSSGFEFALADYDSPPDTINDNRGPIVIMFSPNGRVEEVIFMDRDESIVAGEEILENVTSFRPAGAIHLLIGRDDEGTDGNPENLDNQESIWVSIGQTAGAVTTSENMVPIVEGATVTPGDKRKRIAAARQWARRAQIGDSSGF